MPRKAYVLTARAETDLREARAWSRARRDQELTERYFQDLHEGAEYLAKNHRKLRKRPDLAGGTALLVYPIREHYLVYEPLGERFVAIVAVIRQRRDLPAILQKWAAPIRRELDDIRNRIERGEIRPPGRPSPRTPRKK